MLDKESITGPLFQNDESEANFEYFYHQYAEGLFQFAYQLLGRRDAAQDVIQEVFIKAWDVKERFVGAANFKAYLFVSVRNRCLDHLRVEKIRDAKLKEISTQTEVEEEAHAEAAYLYTSLISFVRKEISKLKPEFQEVLGLILFKGYTPVEVATELGLSPELVRKRKQRAMEELRIELLKNGLTNYSLGIGVIKLTLYILRDIH